MGGRSETEAAPDRSPRPCASCGRMFEWRRARARSWSTARYCSDACRRSRPGPLDRALEEAIVRLLDARPAGGTCCPSEAARAVRPDDWRPLLERTRRAARRLVVRGELQIVQGGRAVDPDRAKGPIRLRARP